MGERKRVRERRTEEGKEESMAEETGKVAGEEGRRETTELLFCRAEITYISRDYICTTFFSLIFLLLLVMMKEDEDCLPQFPPSH